jgi:hypothetical protein
MSIYIDIYVRPRVGVKKEKRTANEGGKQVIT